MGTIAPVLGARARFYVSTAALGSRSSQHAEELKDLRMQTCKEALREGLNEFIFRNRAEDTFSQSGATTSLRSTITVEAAAASYYVFERWPVDGPDYVVAVSGGELVCSEFAIRPVDYKIITSSPNMLSEPRPPITKSLPGPPSRFCRLLRSHVRCRRELYLCPFRQVHCLCRLELRVCPYRPCQEVVGPVGSPQSVGTISTDLLTAEQTRLPEPG